MKKNEFAKLALMGLASGMLASNLIEAQQGIHSEEIQKFIAANGCKGKSGCGGAIAQGCKGKNGCGGAVAQGCSGKSGCNGTVAQGCKGKNGCNGTVAQGCSGKNGCSGTVAQGCSGKNGCNGAIAENEPHKSLTSPAPIPKDSKGSKGKVDPQSNPNDQNIGYHLMTDDELTLELNDEALKIYQQMTPEAKALTRLVASARCNGTNECKGLNACKTETNQCAGKGSCKGQGKCAFSDKNLAVRVVAEQMKAKRQGLTK